MRAGSGPGYLKDLLHVVPEDVVEVVLCKLDDVFTVLLLTLEEDAALDHVGL